MPMQTLHDLYVEELKDLYSAEQQILRAIPKMVRGVQSPQLQNAFNEHLAQTRRQVERLDHIFQELGTKPGGKQCKGMEGVLEDGTELLKEDGNPMVKDAGILAAAQHVEHYEMAGYGAVRTYAQLLGYDDAARALQQTLNEEGETDHQLTKLAESLINTQAEETSGMQMMERDMRSSGSRDSSSSSRSTGTNTPRTSSSRSGSRSGSRSTTGRSGTRSTSARSGSRPGSQSTTSRSRTRSSGSRRITASRTSHTGSRSRSTRTGSRSRSR